MPACFSLQAYLHPQSLPPAFDADEVPQNAGAIAAALYLSEHPQARTSDAAAPADAPCGSQAPTHPRSGRLHARADTNSTRQHSDAANSCSSSTPGAAFATGTAPHLPGASAGPDHVSAGITTARGAMHRLHTNRPVPLRKASRVSFAHGLAHAQPEHSKTAWQDEHAMAGRTGVCSPAVEQLGIDQTCSPPEQEQHALPSLMTALEADVRDGQQHQPHGKSVQLHAGNGARTSTCGAAPCRRRMPLRVQQASASDGVR